MNCLLDISTLNSLKIYFCYWFMWLYDDVKISVFCSHLVNIFMSFQNIEIQGGICKGGGICKEISWCIIRFAKGPTLPLLVYVRFALFENFDMVRKKFWRRSRFEGMWRMRFLPSIQLFRPCLSLQSFDSTSWSKLLGEKVKYVKILNVFHRCWGPRYIRSFKIYSLGKSYWSFKNYSADFEF